MNKILAFSLLIMLVFTTLALFATKENTTALPPDSGSGKASIGGAFNLTDQDGKAVSDIDYRRKYMLVFFGFTHCPDICPVAMANVTAAMDILGPKADKLTPIFITVDPAQDSPQVLKTFLSNFDHRIVGLTGSEEQIKSAAAAYKAYYAQAESAHDGDHDHQGERMVNHSGLMYLMNDKGEYVTHFNYDTAPDMLAQKIAEHLQ